MLLEIVQYGNPVLKEKCRPVEHLDASLKDLANNMLETMYAAEGVGLAAPQVNVPVQLVVIDIPAEEESVTWLKVDGEDKQGYSDAAGRQTGDDRLQRPSRPLPSA